MTDAPTRSLYIQRADEIIADVLADPNALILFRSLIDPIGDKVTPLPDSAARDAFAGIIKAATESTLRHAVQHGIRSSGDAVAAPPPGPIALPGSCNNMTLLSPSGSGPFGPGVVLDYTLPPGASHVAWTIRTKEPGLGAPLLGGFGASFNGTVVGAPGLTERASIFDNTVQGKSTILTFSVVGSHVFRALGMAVLADGSFGFVQTSDFTMT